MNRPELVCQAGTPAALRTAVDAGADAVYCGFQNATNARNFLGLNLAHGTGRVSKNALASLMRWARRTRSPRSLCS
jgi:collagenase-like PrtC family protease